MEKVIGAYEVRRQFGQMLSGILANKDRFIVERHGQPVAAVIPVSVYEQWKRQRETFFDQMEEIAQRSSLSPEEADSLADEAIAEVRAARRS